MLSANWIKFFFFVDFSLRHLNVRWLNDKIHYRFLSYCTIGYVCCQLCLLAHPRLAHPNGQRTFIYYWLTGPYVVISHLGSIFCFVFFSFFFECSIRCLFFPIPVFKYKHLRICKFINFHKFTNLHRQQQSNPFEVLNSVFVSD